MKTKPLIYGVILFFVFLCSKAQNNLTALVGVDLGYSTYFKRVGYKGEANLNCLFAYKHLALNVNGGIAPFTNFGTIVKRSASIGFTTKMDKKFSWHLLLGFIIGGTEKEKYVDELNNRNYWFSIGGPSISTGFYYKIKQSNCLVGFNTGFSFCALGQPYRYYIYYSNAPFLYGKLSLNYKLNFKKNENN
ncbi:MAG: hypothetical protein KF900_00730 [Bacteroidetes bacterium]|nr:hypothetical protein [Bacteroidota bacterium]